ncbi:MAG: hypothetical protein DSY46_04085 [Hydrogenimonas sp.]|nr:MAG: hypothetical protein DSY46_04085 [Hydrogenimonas sp.]
MCIDGCGLGLRDNFIDEIENYQGEIDFLEVAPENLMHMDKKEAKRFARICEKFSVVAHGLSLSLGDVETLNIKHLKRLKKFLDRYGIEEYSEHLSFTSLDGVQSYELLPLPMTEPMVEGIVKKIGRVEEILERPLIIENPTYYTCLPSTMEESAFIMAILDRSGAKLLLDLNNLFVNSFNHGFNAKDFIDAIDLDCVAYCHIAGHMVYDDDLLIDTHGMAVKDVVWDLMRYTMEKKRLPIMLERDNNIPPLTELIKEYQTMQGIYHAA